MLSFPNAKINLGLRITSKRPDGYHNIESCFYPIRWCDALEVLPSEKLNFTTSGLSIPGETDSNLCLKAYHLIEKIYQIPPVHIHLHKVIPMGAGLGGGSSDGAFTLKILNELFKLGLASTQLQELAGQLGSDCPFFIENKPAIVRGTGDMFSECPIDLSDKYLAIKNPGIHISTKEAYHNINPQASSLPIESILSEPLTNWKMTLKNDFEKAVTAHHPEINQIKQELYNKGAIYASMTGSGSTVYGIFDQSIDLSGYRTFAL